MAIPGAGVFAIEVGRRLWGAMRPRRRWIGLLALILAVAAVAGAGLISGRFGRATAVFDKDWFDLVFARSAYAFLAHWSVTDWLQVLATVASLLSAIAVFARRRSAFAAVLAVAACACHGCSASLPGTSAGTSWW